MKQRLTPYLYLSVGISLLAVAVYYNVNGYSPEWKWAVQGNPPGVLWVLGAFSFLYFFFVRKVGAR